MKVKIYEVVTTKNRYGQLMTCTRMRLACGMHVTRVAIHGFVEHGGLK